MAYLQKEGTIHGYEELLHEASLSLEEKDLTSLTPAIKCLTEMRCSEFTDVASNGIFSLADLTFYPRVMHEYAEALFDALVTQFNVEAMSPETLCGLLAGLVNLSQVPELEPQLVRICNEIERSNPTNPRILRHLETIKKNLSGPGLDE